MTVNTNTIANEAGTGGPDFVGMPTVAGDPVVESGSNSDGEWTKWADGTQVCRNSINLGPINAFGSGTDSDVYRTDTSTWVYPSAFQTDTPTVTGSAQASDPSNGHDASVGFNSRTISSTSVFAIAVWGFSSSSGDGILYLTATGPWK